MERSSGFRVIPFRLKLTLAISGIVVALLGTLFFVIQRNIETEFRRLVTRQLEQTERFVSEKMGDRRAQLFSSAVTAAHERLIHDLISDTSLSPATRQDILADEVQPGLMGVDLVAITDPDGNVLAQELPATGEPQPVVGAVTSEPWFADLLAGADVAGHVFVGGQYHQIVGVPVFLAEEMIGAVLVGKTLEGANLIEIKESTDADVVVLADGRVAVSTIWTWSNDEETLESYLQAFSAWLPSALARTAGGADRATELDLLGERFLARIEDDPDDFVPPYVVVQSLDRRLAFLDDLELTTIGIGVLGVGIGIAMGFGLALAVSRPIQVLRLATREVERENLDHRVDIRTRDEFAQLGNAFNDMISGLAEKQRIRSALDKSVSPEVAEHILSSEANLGGERRRTTILFSDMRAFSTLAEALDPTELIELLNGYFTRINGCIRSHHGVTDKFIGDAVMALFGAPIPRAEHALDAIRAGLDMLGVLEVFNREVALPRFETRLRIGVGINTGDVVAGLVGSADRLAYTCVGDDVNLASRLEGLTERYGADLVIGESTFRELQQASPDALREIPVRELDRVRAKGKRADVAIYEVLRRGETARELQPQLDLFAEALRCLRAADFEGAILHLGSVLSAAPRDEAARIMLERCEKYAADPELYERDHDGGVRVLTTK